METNHHKRMDTDKGFDGENEVRRLLEKIFHGTVKQFKGTYEDKGIDMTVQFNSLIGNSLLNIGVQVKTGLSYIKNEDTKYLEIKFDRTQFEKMQAYSMQPTMLIWLNDQTNTAYWTAISKHTSSDKIIINKRAEMSPLTKFDFLLKYHKHNFLNEREKIKTEDKKLNLLVAPLKRNVGLLDFGKEYYKKIRTTFLGHRSGKKGVFKNPFLGDIKVTRAGWRTMTRAGRRKYFVKNSIELLRDLDYILEFPSKIIQFENLYPRRRGNWYYISRRIVLKLVQLKFQNSTYKDIFLILRERIKYPVDWKNMLTPCNEIKRELVFENIYEKIKKGTIP